MSDGVERCVDEVMEIIRALVRSRKRLDEALSEPTVQEQQVIVNLVKRRLEQEPEEIRETGLGVLHGMQIALNIRRKGRGGSRW